jgi:hypothetical protein
MATVTVTATSVTTAETRAADFALARINAERTAQSLPTFANMLRYLEWHIVNVLIPEWSQEQVNDAIAIAQLYERFKNSTDAQRTAALAALAAAS